MVDEGSEATAASGYSLGNIGRPGLQFKRQRDEGGGPRGREPEGLTMRLGLWMLLPGPQPVAGGGGVVLVA